MRANSWIVVSVGCVLMGLGFNVAALDGWIAKKVVVDSETGAAAASQAEMKIGSATISAKLLEYEAGVEGRLRLVDLSDASINNGSTSISLQRATYYPELATLLTKRVVVRPLTRRAQQSLGGNLVALTCSGGTLYADGYSLGSSWCTPDFGGGSTTYSCGGSGGNWVKIFHSPYACQGN